MSAILLALALAQSPVYDPDDGPILSNPAVMSPGYAYFEFAPASGAGMGSVCACTAVTGAKGEAMTFTRATAAECYSNDGQTLTQCGANLPRVSSGTAASTWLGLWNEGGATNLLLYSRDLSQAAWTKTNMTCAKTATGMRADANSASTCTASAANATVCQTIVVAAASRTTSWHIKRRTGTGAVTFARDGATYSSDVASSLSSTVWRRVVPDDTPGCAGGNCVISSTMTSGGANPTVCLKLATSGDAVDIDFVQDESGAYATSPILTTTVAASRSAETATMAYGSTAVRSLSGYVQSRPMRAAFTGYFAAYQATTDFLAVYINSTGAGTAQQTAVCGLFVGGSSTVSGNNPTTWSSNNPLALGCDVVNATSLTGWQRGMTTSAATALTSSSTSVAYLGTAGPATVGNVDGVIKGVCIDGQSGACTGRFRYTADSSPIAVIGDSLALGYTGGASTGPPSELQRLTGRLTYNVATGGHDTADCLDDYRTRVAGKGYATVIIHCGINGINQGIAAATLWPDMETLLNEAYASGAKVIVDEIMAWSASALWTAGKQTETVAFNASVASWCSTHGAAVCVLNYDAMRTGTALNAAYDSGDGLHMNAAGNTALATLWQAANP